MKSIFLGYKPGTKGLLLYDTNDKEIHVSRNVHFEELVFAYKPNPNASSSIHLECTEVRNCSPGDSQQGDCVPPSIFDPILSEPSKPINIIDPAS